MNDFENGTYYTRTTVDDVPVLDPAVPPTFEDVERRRELSLGVDPAPPVEPPLVLDQRPLDPTWQVLFRSRDRSRSGTFYVDADVFMVAEQRAKERLADDELIVAIERVTPYGRTSR